MIRVEKDEESMRRLRDAARALWTLSKKLRETDRNRERKTEKEKGRERLKTERERERVSEEQ